MDLDQLTKFQNYKHEISLEPEKDLFFCSSHYGASEEGFFEWLSNERLFMLRFCKGESTLDSTSLELTATIWYRYTERYEAHVKKAYIINEYPEGYFECKTECGAKVATFLPEPSNDGKYRLSYYTAGGPISHNVFNERNQALSELASGHFKHAEGALDSLTGTLEWDRGVTVASWLNQGLHPNDGFKRDSHLDHVKREFAELY